jgi:hypothetical protein
MIAMAAALRVADAKCEYGFSVQPRWELRRVAAAQ